MIVVQTQFHLDGSHFVDIICCVVFKTQINGKLELNYYCHPHAPILLKRSIYVCHIIILMLFIWLYMSIIIINTNALFSVTGHRQRTDTPTFTD